MLYSRVPGGRKEIPSLPLDMQSLAHSGDAGGDADEDDGDKVAFALVLTGWVPLSSLFPNEETKAPSPFSDLVLLWVEPRYRGRQPRPRANPLFPYPGLLFFVSLRTYMFS